MLLLLCSMGLISSLITVPISSLQLNASAATLVSLTRMRETSSKAETSSSSKAISSSVALAAESTDLANLSARTSMKDIRILQTLLPSLLHSPQHLRRLRMCVSTPSHLPSNILVAHTRSLTKRSSWPIVSDFQPQSRPPRHLNSVSQKPTLRASSPRRITKTPTLR